MLSLLVMLVRSSELLTVPIPAGLVLFRFLIVPCVPLVPPGAVALPLVVLLLFLHTPVRQHSGIQQLFLARFPHVVLLDDTDVVLQLLPKFDASLGILKPEPPTGFLIVRSYTSASEPHGTLLHWLAIVLVENCHTKTPARCRMKARCGLTEVLLRVDKTRRLRRHCSSCIVAAERSFRTQATKHTVSPSRISLPARILMRDRVGCRLRYADADSLRCCTASHFLLTQVCRSKVIVDCRPRRADRRDTR